MRAVVARTRNIQEAEKVLEQYYLNKNIVVEYYNLNIKNQLTIVYREKTEEEKLKEQHYKNVVRLEKWAATLIDIVLKVDRTRATNYANKRLKQNYQASLLEYALRSKKIDQDVKNSYNIYLKRVSEINNKVEEILCK